MGAGNYVKLKYLPTKKSRNYEREGEETFFWFHVYVNTCYMIVWVYKITVYIYRSYTLLNIRHRKTFGKVNYTLLNNQMKYYNIRLYVLSSM